MQHMEVSCAVRRFFKSLGFKGYGTQITKSGNEFLTKDSL